MTAARKPQRVKELKALLEQAPNLPASVDAADALDAAAADHDHDSDYAAADHNHDSDYAAADHNHDSDYVAKTAAVNIPDASGGTTVDAEARTAIAAILDLLEGTGLMAAAE